MLGKSYKYAHLSLPQLSRPQLVYAFNSSNLTNPVTKFRPDLLLLKTNSDPTGLVVYISVSSSPVYFAGRLTGGGG